MNPRIETKRSAESDRRRENRGWKIVSSVEKYRAILNKCGEEESVRQFCEWLVGQSKVKSWQED
jgi:hypothetical protein